MKAASYQQDQAYIIERYNRRLRELGPTIGALASGTRERQFLRFRILTELGKLEGSSIIDLGCGFGDLLAYCAEQAITLGDYCGIDINPSLVEEARRRYPHRRFECRDILADCPPPDHVDFVLSSSAFNNRFQHVDNYDFLAQILQVSFRTSRRGTAVNLMTSYVDYESPEAFYYSPERVFSLCKSITASVVLRHDYPLFDFTVYLYK